jgi:hypothetical protein
VLGQVRRDLKRWDVDTIVVTSRGIDPRAAVHVFRAALGVSPRTENHAEVWLHVTGLVDRLT